MRSRLAGFFSVVVAAQLCAGCSSSASPAGGLAAEPDGNGTPLSSSSTSVNGADGGSDAGESELPALALVVGNALCNANPLTGCYPDTTYDACDLPTDGGAPDASADGGMHYPGSCHVVTEGTEVVTVCLPSKLQGMYASTCTQSTDCAPGWECMSGGTCRHYCCGGNSACSDNQFCDVQPTAMDPNTRVPVCLAEFPCTLLDPDSCLSGQQCSVVKEDGTTSCVTLGPQGDGQSCEVEHCQAGFVCLGTMGNRACAPLCSTVAATNPCTGGRSCIGTLPLFKDATVGACQ